MIASMTAFARSQQQAEPGCVTCEVRSVNHRYLELAVRLPDSLRQLEPQVRERVRNRVGRGKVDLQLRLDSSGAAPQLQLNRQVLVQLLAVLEQVRRDAPDAGHADPVELLRWPGVLGEAAADTDAQAGLALAAVDDALDQLDAARHAEGERLRTLMTTRLDEIRDIVTEVAAIAPTLANLQRERISARLAELADGFTQGGSLDPGRLEQEVALAAQKADIAEEVDRLGVHVQEVGDVLAAGGACGRRLDFLMQELNREANTLASKSVVTDTARRAVDLKVLIEQIREQVQNVE